MSPAAFLALVALTAAAVVGAGVVVANHAEFDGSTLVAGGPLFPGLEARAGDAQRVVVEHPRYRLELQKRGAQWLAASEADYPVKPALVPDLVSGLGRLTSVEAKTSNSEWYPYIRVGGEGAAESARGRRVAVFGTGQQPLADVILGRQSAAIGYAPAGALFVRETASAGAWLVEGTVNLPDGKTEWFEPLFSIAGPDVERIAVLAGSHVLLEASRSAEQRARYAPATLSPEVGPAGSTISSDAVRRLLQPLVSATFVSARSREQVAIPPEARVVRFTTTGGLELTATLAEVDGTTWVVFDASGAGSESITAKTGRWVFDLGAETSALLAMPAADLIYLPGTDPELPPVQPAGAAPAALPTP